MKKISIIAILSTFVVPSMAEELNMTTAQPSESDIVSQYGQYEQKSEQNFEQYEKTEPQKETVPYEEEYTSNPETRFPHGMQLGIGISPTSGLNGFIGYNNKKFDSFWAKRFGIRLDFAGYSPIKRHLNKTINHYAGKDGFEIDDGLKIENFALNAKHMGALIDFYPFGDTWFLGGWRISGGYIKGKLCLDADIHSISKDGKIEFELNDNDYYYKGDEMRAKARADWKYSGPYVGTGFDLGLFYGFKIYMDAGVVFTDKTAKLDLEIPINGLYNENDIEIQEGTAEHKQFLYDKNKTLEDARKEIKDYPYYPIIKLGLMYRF